MMNILATLMLLVTQVHQSQCFVEGLYCGEESCYDVLQVSRDASRSDLSKAYRKLAKLYHPDVSKLEDADIKFRKVATAYEILRDDEQRKDYDYMLDNPEEAYYHYYKYYKRRLTPKVDVRIVVAVTITIISILQYLQKRHRYEEAINYAMQNPKFRNQAMQVIHQEGLLSSNINTKKNKNKKSKDERKQEEERVLREIVEDSIDIKGGYSKPTYKDVLWIQLVVLPFYLVVYVEWLLRWVWKFWFLKLEYGMEEKEYLTYKGLGFTQQYWEALDKYSKENYLNRDLWKKENLESYKLELEQEYRVKLAESGRHKMWRRYMKKGGPGQMSFAED
ncbi:dnaJ homolog subfamily C member 25 homolog [Hydra vulgaris]|uniref:DnaJ homolog subfamily C member 25 homolog n=1 Tax=Hydra vulgaris TaxID=6087 RepID=A0ABM4BDY6_HYDVU